MKIVPKFRIVPLTSRQRAVQLFIQEYIWDYGYSPSRQEIAYGVGVSSRSGLQRHIEALEAKGYLSRLPFKARALSVEKWVLPKGIYTIIPEVERTDIAINSIHETLVRYGWVEPVNDEEKKIWGSEI